jgi:hypothetical protein
MNEAYEKVKYRKGITIREERRISDCNVDQPACLKTCEWKYRNSLILYLSEMSSICKVEDNVRVDTIFRLKFMFIIFHELYLFCLYHAFLICMLIIVTT